MNMKESKESQNNGKVITSDNDKNIPELKWAERLTFIMDEAIRIPGTNIKFGLDPIIGLFPWIGDTVSYVISGLIILDSIKYRVSGKTIFYMLINLTVDFLGGSIPVVGDIFDFSYKANRKNLDLIKENVNQGKYSGSPALIIIAVLIALIGIFVGVVFGVWKLFEYIFS